MSDPAQKVVSKLPFKKQPTWLHALRESARSLSKDAKATYVASALKVTCNLCVTFLLIRELGSTYYGQIVTVLALAAIISSICEVRNTEAVAYYMAKESAIAPVFIVALCIDLIIFTAYFFAAFLAVYFLPIWGSGDYPLDNKMVVILFCYSSLALLKSTMTGWAIVKNQLRVIARFALLEEVAKLVLVITFLCWGRLDVLNAALSYLASGVISLCSASIWLVVGVRRALVAEPQGLDVVRFSEYGVFVSKSFLATFLKALHSRVDTFVAGTMVSLDLASLFDVGRKMMAPLSFLLQPLQSLTFLNMLQAMKVGRHSLGLLASKYFRRTLILSSFYSGIVVLGIFAALALSIISLPFRAFEVLIFFVGCAFAASMWWCRNFSNLTSQSYSIFGNAIAALYAITVLPLSAAYSESILWYLSSVCGLSVLLVIYWYRVLIKYGEDVDRDPPWAGSKK